MKLSSSYDQTWTDDERREHTERLQAMLEDDGDTWDLSDNDKAALTMALSAVMLASKSICSYCGHVGEKTASAMVDHVLACEKRPEARMVDMLIALRAYAQHLPECSQAKPWFKGRPLHHCSCGLDDLLGPVESAKSMIRRIHNTSSNSIMLTGSRGADD